jgi:DNA-binding YbaB/EbfC family protein
MTTGMPDFSALLAQAQQMQQQMMEVQEGLADVHAVGTAGGGLVAATVDGRGDMIALTITPAAYDADDPDALDTLADLVVAAVRDAKAEAERLAAQRLSDATGGLAGFAGGESPAVELDLSALEGLLPPGLLAPPPTADDETGEPLGDR